MLISPWWVLIWNLDLAYLKHYWVYRQTELIWQPWLMMPWNLLLCQAAEQLEFAPLQQWSWMETCVDEPAMWIKPNVPNLPMLLLNFWKGWSARVVVIPAPSPMSMQGFWQWCFSAGKYAEAAHDMMISQCVTEKDATPSHVITSQTHIKGMCKPYDTGKTACTACTTFSQSLWEIFLLTELMRLKSVLGNYERRTVVLVDTKSYSTCWQSATDLTANSSGFNIVNMQL